MELKIRYSNKFKKRLKLAVKSGLDISLLENVVEKLKNRFVYLMEEDILVLTLINTGTHSDLFNE